jgi:hypothetical protein
MELDALFKWLFETPVAVTIRENESLFPWVEAVHVLAITLVIGSISVVDLRLLGFASRERAVTVLTRQVLPWTWAAFALAVITGAALFSSNAVNYAHNFYFQGKMVLLLLAGLNMLTFHFLFSRDIAHWDTRLPPPAGARFAGAASLLLWIGVVGFGRWIGFTLQPTLAG